MARSPWGMGADASRKKDEQPVQSEDDGRIDPRVEQHQRAVPLERARADFPVGSRCRIAPPPGESRRLIGEIRRIYRTNRGQIFAAIVIRREWNPGWELYYEEYDEPAVELSALSPIPLPLR